MAHPVAAGFEVARREVLSKFSDEERETFSRFTSIKDVYDATDEIQTKQAETRTLQNLGKIQPYLECLNQYSCVIDTIVQIKPDFLGVIWVFALPCNNLIDLIGEIDFQGAFEDASSCE